MEPLRVLQIIPALAKGGAERLVLDICHAFNRREEIQYHLVVLSPRNKYLQLSEGINIRVVQSKAGIAFPGRVIAETHELDQVIKEFQPQVIHSHIFYADQVSRQNLYPDICYFSHVHGRTTQYERVSGAALLTRMGWIRQITRNNILHQYQKCNNHFITNSAYIGDYVQRSLQTGKEKITVLLNAIDLLKFRKQSRQWPGQILRLVFTGSLEERKNPLLLPLIVKELIERGVNTHLSILGDGKLRSELQNKIVELQLEESITMKGHVDEVEADLAKAHVYVHTATYEPFGLALIEAMATGLPVVCLNGGGNSEVMQNGYNGFILEENNHKIFADKILEVVSDSATYQDFSKHAIESSKQFDIEKYVSRLIALYHDRLRRPNTSSMNAG